MRQKYKKKTLRPRKGDSVKIVRGGFKGIEGKVSRVDGQKGKLFVEGVNREKIAGGTALAPDRRLEGDHYQRRSSTTSSGRGRSRESRT